MVVMMATIMVMIVVVPALLYQGPMLVIATVFYRLCHGGLLLEGAQDFEQFVSKLVDGSVLSC